MSVTRQGAIAAEAAGFAAEGEEGLPKVLHVSHFDEYGGAARSAYRLHEGLRRMGVCSRMVVGRKSGNDPDVAEIAMTTSDRVINRIGYELGVQYPYVPSTRVLKRSSWFREADVIQLANIHGGFFGYTALPRLVRRKRLVWCLHDMWSFTGHCGYSHGCERWLTGCGSCPDLAAYPPIRRDGTRVNWTLKKHVYSRLEVTVVAPSRWLGSLASRSPLLSRFPVHVIPYGVDTALFAPTSRDAARSRLGLSLDEPVVLVAGLEPRKGAGLVGAAMAAASATLGKPVRLLVVGGTANAHPPPDVPTHVLGSVDEVTMRDAYAAADVYLLPTRFDNLPNTVLEAMACGSAVVATAVGGIPDVIEDGVNGLLRPPDGEQLGRAVGMALAAPDLRARLGVSARECILSSLTLEHQARSYLDLYREPA